MKHVVETYPPNASRRDVCVGAAAVAAAGLVATPASAATDDLAALTLQQASQMLWSKKV